MASIKHDKIIPEHPAAMSVDLDMHYFNCLDVSHSDALQFLRKETLHLDSVKKGFALIRYNAIGLGWVNILDNRINNLYPAEWRIRMADKNHP
jgi:NOL1/NOP2/fmu family ribosome biogenesis protein